MGSGVGVAVGSGVGVAVGSGVGVAVGSGVGVGVGVTQLGSAAVMVMSSIHQPSPGSAPGATGSATRRQRTSALTLSSSEGTKPPRLTTTWLIESVAAVGEPPVHAARPAMKLPASDSMAPSS